MKVLNIFSGSILKLGALILTVHLAFSCTYDYFEDENNVRIYVPQIKDGTIDNFFISFHTANGNHTRTQSFEAPFDNNVMLKQGLLKFKLNPGETSITCFANYTPGTISQGLPMSQSYKTAPYDKLSLIGQPSTRELRVFLADFKVYPFGHPQSKDSVVVNIDESCQFKGRIISRFQDVPAQITRVEVTYTGVATQVGFDGLFGMFSDIAKFRSVTESTVDAINPHIVVDDMVYPSANLTLAKNSVSVRPIGGRRLVPHEIGLNVDFYQGNTFVGNATFMPGDLALLDDSKKPTDANGLPVSNLILYPRQTIIFNFKGFTLVSIQLNDWGEIHPGEPTPM